MFQVIAKILLLWTHALLGLFFYHCIYSTLDMFIVTVSSVGSTLLDKLLVTSSNSLTAICPNYSLVSGLTTSLKLCTFASPLSTYRPAGLTAWGPPDPHAGLLDCAVLLLSPRFQLLSPAHALPSAPYIRNLQNLVPKGNWIQLP